MSDGPELDLVEDNPVARMMIDRYKSLGLSRRKLENLETVIFPWTPGYDYLRLSINRRFSTFPLFIVRPESKDELCRLYRHIRDKNLPFRIRSGGHDYEGASISSGVLIDLSQLSWVEHRDNKILAVGPGTQLGEILRSFPHKRAFPTGVCPTVAIAGLTLGGGIGFLSRTLGLTCDSLIDGEILLADGSLVCLRDNPDLLWICRGGGGGRIGLILELKFKLSYVPGVIGFELVYPLASLPIVGDLWQRIFPRADRRMNAELAMTPTTVTIQGVSLLSERATRELLAPLLEIEMSQTPLIWPQSYRKVAQYFSRDKDRLPFFKDSSDLVAELLPSEAWTIITEKLLSAPVGLTGNGLEFKAWGGAMEDREPTETAFPHRRNILFSIQYLTSWGTPEQTEDELAWVRSFRLAMANYVTGGAYINYRDNDIVDYMSAYYGINQDRVREIKRKYDPEGVFDGPQPIEG